MSQIMYKQMSPDSHTQVYLDGKPVGVIQVDDGEYYYVPTVGKKFRGPSFKTLAECKASLEED